MGGRERERETEREEERGRDGDRERESCILNTSASPREIEKDS